MHSLREGVREVPCYRKLCGLSHVPPHRPFHNKTYSVWKPNICFIRAKDNYNLVATGHTTPDLTTGKRRERLSMGKSRFLGLSECIIVWAGFLNHPSIWWSGRRECHFDGNWKGLLCPCAPPSVVLGIALAPELHSSTSLQRGGVARPEPDAHLQCVSFWLRTHS